MGPALGQWMSVWVAPGGALMRSSNLWASAQICFLSAKDAKNAK